MRIITGSRRGRKLKTLEGLAVRPTPDRRMSSRPHAPTMRGSVLCTDSSVLAAPEARSMVTIFCTGPLAEL